MSDAFEGPYWEAFFTLHKNLPREGPGAPDDVLWAGQVAGLRPDARILDAACGPGADIPVLRQAAPEGHITAVDKVAQFTDQARALYGDLPRTEIRVGDMTEVDGPFDFIWCAGAVYFLGVEKALRLWRARLAEGGSIAFSQVCWFTEDPPEAARAGWADYPEMTDEKGVLAAVDRAGYACIASRRLGDAAWEAYYGPLDARAAALSPGDSPALRQVMEEARAEEALWRTHRETFGYLLCVVRPA
jgi:SAM-dependent methyltransferase